MVASSFYMPELVMGELLLSYEADTVLNKHKEAARTKEFLF